MIYENDWLTTNVHHFKNNINIRNVRCEYVPGDFEDSSFMDAATKIANTLKNKYEHIYVAYSGGADSTFIVNTLHSVGANFTPIAVEAKHTTEELQRAYANCKRLGLDLVILDFMGEKKDEDLKRLYNRYIMDDNTFKLRLVRASQSIFFFLIIHDYMKKIHSDAILVDGHHALSQEFRYHSWDLFPSLWEKESSSWISFLMYNQHIMYEMASHMNKLNCPPYWDKPTPYLEYDVDRFGLPIVENVNDTETAYRDLLCDMYNIPRESKIQGWKKMDLESKTFYINKLGQIRAGFQPPIFRKKGSNSNYRRYDQIWRSLKS